jgi:hypothetical protein
MAKLWKQWFYLISRTAPEATFADNEPPYINLRLSSDEILSFGVIGSASGIPLNDFENGTEHKGST